MATASGERKNVVEYRRTRKRSRLEKLLMLLVITMGVMIVVINATLLIAGTAIEESDGHYSVTNTHRDTNFRTQRLPDSMKSNPASDLKQEKGEIAVDQRLMRILRHVGIENATQLSEDDRRLLPTWEEVVDRVGRNGPKILGLETCKAYKANVPKDKRRLAVAGPFNSGTHYLHQVLMDNCIYKNPNVENKRKNQNPGVVFSVPWGKHQSPKFRLIHNTKLGQTIDKKNDKLKTENNGELDHPELPSDLEEENRSVLPVVTVRDPFTWWQSMCKSRYSAHWYHIVPEHCPNFIANNVEREWFFKKMREVRRHYDGDPWKVDNVMNKANYTLDKKVVPLWVRYHSENRQHKSLAHMWMDWYKDYYDAEYPRLMIRLEDLVFYPHETLKQVCECANGGSDSTSDPDEDGYFEYIGDENLILTLDSAIRGGEAADKIHGKDRAGLLQAMAKHAGPHSETHRTNGMTIEDLKFATKVLKESEVMSFFGYKVPPESNLEK